MTHYTKYKCKKCDSTFVNYDQFFYLDPKTNEINIENRVLMAIEESESSPLVGNIIETYCGNCNKKVIIYEINPFESRYGACSSIKTLKDSLNRQYEFIREKYEKAVELNKIIENRMEIEVYDFILENEKYFRELLEELIDSNGKFENLKSKFNKIIPYLEYFIGTYINSITIISIIYGSYFYTLNDERFKRDICPNCQNEISYITEDEICPICGGELKIEDKIYID
ncbi:MAG: hypothetical protein Q4Q24_00050 [Methanobrevibacter ruminantium]|uniref:hypothetical protein n=1 Tax=Methanobrevibacter ruminantium TaxID=83816 RepID=UPI0026F17BC8|nr:hypothetical protein [Methanobrevibacter ruminantium]MCI5737955.1 hypothetical protein [Methanobrevibacter ruminantium]MDD6049291.1 hypothetical protein [Methanobrevibacter ruminantium]MDO5841644.1 hypothetical protein [Methanobrevibacter ruminantium]